MRKIGNILTEKSFSNAEFFNVVSTKDELIGGLPTLVIGWEFTKKNYPNADILDWSINQDVFWTFGNREKRQAYESRIEKFTELAIERFIKSIKYVPFSVLTETKESKKDFFNFMETNTAKKEIYINNGMVYIYVPIKEVVYGISIRDIEYIGKDVNKFLSRVYRFLNAEAVNVKAGENISYSMYSRIKNHTYIMPCLCYNND